VSNYDLSMFECGLLYLHRRYIDNRHLGHLTPSGFVNIRLSARPDIFRTWIIDTDIFIYLLKLIADNELHNLNGDFKT